MAWKRTERVGLALVTATGFLAATAQRALAYTARDLHILGGLLLLGWGLWLSPWPWLAGVVCGSALWYMGVFRLTNRGRPPDGPI